MVGNFRVLAIGNLARFYVATSGPSLPDGFWVAVPVPPGNANAFDI